MKAIKQKNNMKDFLKYLEAHLQGNPGIPGQGKKRPGEEDYLANASRKKKEELKDGEDEDLMSLINRSSGFIEGHERELEALATKAIKNLYKGIIERYQIDFDIRLSTNTREIANLLGIRENAAEIFKRKIVNLVSHGEALNTKHLLHSPDVKEGISEIYGNKADEIFKIWDAITKAAARLDQELDPEKRAETIAKALGSGLAGAVDVKWVRKDKDINEANDDDDDDFDLGEDEDGEEGNDKTGNEDIFDFLNKGNINDLNKYLDDNDIDPNIISKNFKPVITAIGRDFPMLLHEAVKGLYNTLAMGGIPEDRDVATIALKKGYARHEEPEEWKYGPSIDGDIRDFINENELIDSYSNVREQVWKYMVDRKKTPTTDFLELIRGILSKTQEARIKVDAIIKIVVNSIKKFYNNRDAQENYKREMEEYKVEKEKYDREIEEYNKKMEEWNKKHPEVEEPEENQHIIVGPIDYSTKTPNELNNLLNQALGVGDYDTAREIGKYLK